jgi:hypothetical protein
MIELPIAACLAQGECREFSQLYDARDVSLLTCMISGQTQVASWQDSHPGWTLQRWSCGFPEDRDRAA